MHPVNNEELEKQSIALQGETKRDILQSVSGGQTPGKGATRKRAGGGPE